MYIYIDMLINKEIDRDALFSFTYSMIRCPLDERGSNIASSIQYDNHRKGVLSCDGEKSNQVVAGGSTTPRRAYVKRRSFRDEEGEDSDNRYNQLTAATNNGSGRKKKGIKQTAVEKRGGRTPNGGRGSQTERYRCSGKES